MHLFFLFIILLLGSCQTGSQPSTTQVVIKGVEGEEQLSLSYIGNMGVLIEYRDQTVIIDGFHKKYKPDYLYPSETTVGQLISGTYKDYTEIEAALVTHKHSDHFDADYLKQFLQNNPDAISVGASQVITAIEAMNDQGNSDFSDRLKVVENKENTFLHEAIQIKGFRCDHVNPSRHSAIQNIAYLLRVGPFSVLHLGDSNWDVAEKALRDQKIKEESIDIAVLPYWMLMESSSAEFVDRLIEPRQIIATHIPPHLSHKDQQTIRALFPDVVLFMVLGESFNYPNQ